jgi:hypothetical protein
VLGLLECAAVVGVTILGFTKVYDAAGGDRNSSFAVLVNCLSFGVWLWSTLIAWGVFWLGWWAFRAGYIKALTLGRSALADNLAEIGASYESLWLLATVVMWQVLYFSWLARVIPKVRDETSSAPRR